jgi:hypothetical protein
MKMNKLILSVILPITILTSVNAEYGENKCRVATKAFWGDIPCIETPNNRMCQIRAKLAISVGYKKGYELRGLKSKLRKVRYECGGANWDIQNAYRRATTIYNDRLANQSNPGVQETSEPPSEYSGLYIPMSKTEKICKVAIHDFETIFNYMGSDAFANMKKGDAKYKESIKYSHQTLNILNMYNKYCQKQIPKNKTKEDELNYIKTTSELLLNYLNKEGYEHKQVDLWEEYKSKY